MRNTIKLSAIISLLFTTQISYSQNSFAIKTGVNIATTRDLIAFPKNRLGWYIGATTKINIKNKISFIPELLYSAKGYRYEDVLTGEVSSMRMNYLNIPLLMSIDIDKKTMLMLGPELGYLINATLYSYDQKTNAISSFPKKLDAGIVVGARHNILKSIAVEARYIYGLKTFYQIDNAGIRRSSATASHRVFQLGLSYSLHKL